MKEPGPDAVPTWLVSMHQARPLYPYRRVVYLDGSDTCCCCHVKWWCRLIVRGRRERPRPSAQRGDRIPRDYSGKSAADHGRLEGWPRDLDGKAMLVEKKRGRKWRSCATLTHYFPNRSFIINVWCTPFCFSYILAVPHNIMPNISRLLLLKKGLPK